MQSVKINLGPSQMEKIKRAIARKEKISIKLSVEDLQNGSFNMFFGPRNFGKIQTALKKNKGVVLDITEDEIRYNKQQGGFIGDLLKGIVNGVKGFFSGNVGKTLVDSVVKPGLAKAGKNILADVATTGINKLKDKILGNSSNDSAQAMPQMTPEMMSQMMAMMQKMQPSQPSQPPQSTSPVKKSELEMAEEKLRKIRQGSGIKSGKYGLKGGLLNLPWEQMNKRGGLLDFPFPVPQRGGKRGGLMNLPRP